MYTMLSVGVIIKNDRERREEADIFLHTREFLCVCVCVPNSNSRLLAYIFNDHVR